MAAMQIPSVKNRLEIDSGKVPKVCQESAEKNTSAEVRTAINNFMAKHEGIKMSIKNDALTMEEFEEMERLTEAVAQEVGPHDFSLSVLT